MSTKRKTLISASLLFVFFILFFRLDPVKQMNIAVASSLKYPLIELKTIFEKENDIELNYIFSSSGKLATQIRKKAPIDVFISANQAFSDKLNEENFIHNNLKLAKGKLGVWSTKESIMDDSLKFILK